MVKSVLILGGCRSGKSSFALERCNQISGPKIFIATSQPFDEEMHDRVKAHQQERGKEWQTIEEPVNIHEKINKFSRTTNAILVDCLTLWIFNLIEKKYDTDQLLAIIGKLEDSIETSQSPIFFVSNEVGSGIVPENKLARIFRDNAGLVNQKIAKKVEVVYYTVAGIPMKIKPAP